MEIILLENILNLGNIGDKVSVKNGYGRNFLLKEGKALRFNKENEELVSKKKDELNKKNTETKNKFKEIAKLINNKTFKFNKESKENGELYGSIKPKEITNLIKEIANAEVSPSQIILKEDLNKIGIFKANINFHSEVTANISIKNAPIVDYKNVSLLKKYISDNGKIISSKITSVSFSKQKKLTREIKKAKILGLI